MAGGVKNENVKGDEEKEMIIMIIMKVDDAYAADDYNDIKTKPINKRKRTTTMRKKLWKRKLWIKYEQI